MKKHIALLFLSLGFFTACDMVSGEGEGADNAVYMGNTNSSGVISMVVSNDKGGSSVITPRLANIDRKSTRLNSSHANESRMPSSA